MNRLEMFGDVFEMTALDIGAQIAADPREIVNRHRHCDAIGRAGNTQFVVGCGNRDGEADDLPRRGEPRHHQ